MSLRVRSENRLRLVAVTAACWLMLQSHAVLAAIAITTVPVGNAGNLSDSNARGGVFHDYRIGRTEVTVTQYAAFLSAVAKTDTYALYHPNMGFEGSISRTGAAGTYIPTMLLETSASRFPRSVGSTPLDSSTGCITVSRPARRARPRPRMALTRSAARRPV